LAHKGSFSGRERDQEGSFFRGKDRKMALFSHLWLSSTLTFLLLTILYLFFISSFSLELIPHIGGNSALLTILPVLLSLGGKLFFRKGAVFFSGSFLAFLFFLLGTLFYLDFRIYRLFHLHLTSGVILSTIFLPGGWETLHMNFLSLSGWLSLFLGGIVGALLFLGIFSLLRFLHKVFYLSPFFVTLLLLFALIGEKGIYTYRTFREEIPFGKRIQALPFYLPISAGKFWSHWVSKPSLPVRAKQEFSFQEGAVPPENRRNFIWIVWEGFRNSDFRPEVTPFLWEISRKGVVYRKHLSGGNSTRFGLFSLWGHPAFLPLF